MKQRVPVVNRHSSCSCSALECPQPSAAAIVIAPHPEQSLQERPATRCAIGDVGGPVRGGFRALCPQRLCRWTHKGDCGPPLEQVLLNVPGDPSGAALAAVRHGVTTRRARHRRSCPRTPPTMTRGDRIHYAAWQTTVKLLAPAPHYRKQ